jgi:serine/threonine protein kinase
VKPIMQALLTSVLLLHESGIVHGDIKPKNIMRTGGVGSIMYRLLLCLLLSPNDQHLPHRTQAHRLRR